VVSPVVPGVAASLARALRAAALAVAVRATGLDSLAVVVRAAAVDSPAERVVDRVVSASRARQADLAAPELRRCRVPAEAAVAAVSNEAIAI